MKTNIVVQFDDVPLNKEISFKLFDWYQTLDDNQDTTHPIPLSAQVLDSFKLPDGRIIHKDTMITLSVWRGIYAKWDSCYKPQSLQSTRPVVIAIHKKTKRKWSITKIEQGEQE